MKRLACALLASALCHCEPEPAADLGPTCGTTQLSGELASTFVNEADLLIVVSDAPSMVQEQALLARELPALARALASGELSPTERHDPLRDVHIGIVSADLGVAAEPQLAGCSAIGGDASLQVGSSAGACGELPAFLSYRVPVPEDHPLVTPPGPEARDALAIELGCAASLGSTGCGVLQPLEAALRALWPSGLSLEHTPHVVPVFAREPQGQRANAGFLRNDPARGSSVLQVLVISDGDDCSLQHAQAFADAARGAAVDPNATCALRPELLLEVVRYARGLRALRPNNEDVVVFGAITGVPTDFVLSASDRFDPAARAARFAALQVDPRMQPEAGEDGALRPVCERDDARATPAPRLVELARAFGANGALLSICRPDWRLALRPLFELTDSRVDALGCLPRRPVRDARGRVPCDVLWELPPPEYAPAGTPSECSGLPFLREHTARPRTDDGRAVCEVPQLAVTGLPGAPQLEPGAGWFFDDFSPSDGLRCACGGATCNGIFYAPNRPPPGVAVRVQCLETHCWLRDGGACDPAACSVP